MKKKKIIVVSGTPAAGKTRLSKKLSKILDFRYTDVNNLIKKEKLYDSYDKSKRCYVVNTKKLNNFLKSLIKDSEKDLIIDSHLSHFLPKKYVDLCIITTCDIKILNKRLEKRKYSKNKIKDNLESEIFEICLIEAKKKKHNIHIIDCSKKLDLKEIGTTIKKKLKI